MPLGALHHLIPNPRYFYYKVLHGHLVLASFDFSFGPSEEEEGWCLEKKKTLKADCSLLPSVIEARKG